jgi:hypothetical protein
MIDVAISSCARTDILEMAISSFRKHIISKEKFRLIICEDIVDDKERQSNGKEWIEKHSDWFDTIIFSDKKLTYVYCFSEILRYIESTYFFRLEDDVEFFEDIEIDLIVDYLNQNKNISQAIFRRDVHNLNNSKMTGSIGKRDLFEVNLYSIATGIFNTNWTRKIVGLSGTKECHECKVLTPSMNTLGAKSVVIGGVKDRHALIECGNKKGYKKGKWK